MNAITAHFDRAFAEVFGRATPVSGGDNFNMARAQSLLTGDLIGGVCPPLTPEQARDVLRWNARKPFPSSPSASQQSPVSDEELRDGFRLKYGG